MPAGRILPVFGFAILILVGMFAVSASYESVGVETTSTEEFTPSAGSLTDLNHSNLDSAFYDESVTVTTNNSSSATGPERVAKEGTDYEWIEDNGTVRPLAGGILDGATVATITYGYTVPSETEDGLVDVSADTLEVAQLLVLVAVVGAVAIAVRRLAG